MLARSVSHRVLGFSPAIGWVMVNCFCITRAEESRVWTIQRIDLLFCSIAFWFGQASFISFIESFIDYTSRWFKKFRSTLFLLIGHTGIAGPFQRGEICALCFNSLTKFPQAVINSVEAGNLSGGSIQLSIFSPANAISTEQMKALITAPDEWHNEGRKLVYRMRLNAWKIPHRASIIRNF